ncbi:hypothetical protein ABTE40_21340, partial [Acinetobacter baumannii]
MIDDPSFDKREALASGTVTLESTTFLVAASSPARTPLRRFSWADRILEWLLSPMPKARDITASY